VKAPTSAGLAWLTETLALRIGRSLERQGLRYPHLRGLWRGGAAISPLYSLRSFQEFPLRFEGSR
jgi:hypothetical protein